MKRISSGPKFAAFAAISRSASPRMRSRMPCSSMPSSRPHSTTGRSRFKQALDIVGEFRGLPLLGERLLRDAARRPAASITSARMSATVSATSAAFMNSRRCA